MFEGRFGKIKLTTENREIRKISISGVCCKGVGSKRKSDYARMFGFLKGGWGE